MNAEILDELSAQCDEFLIHGVDVEGKASGVEKDLVRLLAEWGKRSMTYAGGIGSLEELQEFAESEPGETGLYHRKCTGSFRRNNPLSKDS